jgi:predicted nucleic acid-binding protein
MGSLTLPSQGSVYVDANCIIYSYERVEPYLTQLEPLWDAIDQHLLTIMTSELTFLEVLVRPLRTQNTVLEAGFRRMLASPDLRLVPVSFAVLELAAHLRAATAALKTPDAIHAATALEWGCTLLVTNDVAFKKVPGLTVTLLSELAIPPTP